jgi:hypothetical protein
MAKKLRDDQMARLLLKPQVRNDVRIVGLLLDASASLRRFGGTSFTYSTDEREACLQLWLIYLGSLLAMVADAVAMMASNHSSLAASCVQRQAVEYVAKALYFDKHPEEAWLQYFYAAKDRLSIFRDQGKANTDDYWSACCEYSKALQKCPEIAKRKPAKIETMMKEFSDGKRDTYANLVRYPSQVLHASALGMSQVLSNESGGIRAEFQVSQPEGDAQLLELAHYLVLFGQIYDRRVTALKFAANWKRLMKACALEYARHDRKYPIDPKNA